MAAAWLARSLKSPDVLDSLDLGGGYEIAQIMAPPAFVGRSLQELGLRAKYDVNLITIAKGRGAAALSSTRQAVQKVLGIPLPDRAFEADDILVLFGHGKDVRRMMRDHEMG